MKTIGDRSAPAVLFIAFFTLALGACSGQKKAAQIKTATESAGRIKDGVEDYATNQQHWPTRIEDLKVGGDEMPGVSYAIGEGGVVAVYFADGSSLPGARLVYTPSQDTQQNVSWTCVSQGFPAELKPADCS